ncbi:MAG: hypothetical protein ACM3WV_10120 [Bacillota bacterium]
MKNLIVIGAWGSGKTELALHFALKLSESGTRPVSLVDLDITKPYFRSRELVETLRTAGIAVLSNSLGYEADLPALSPAIYGTIEREDPAVFDIGGDESGSRVLGRFSSFFNQAGYRMLMVINPYRPDSRNARTIGRLAEKMENKSRLKIHGLIANPNLGNETTAGDWLFGRETVFKVAQSMDKPLLYTTVGPGLRDRIRQDNYTEELLYLKLMVKPPWEFEGR